MSICGACNMSIIDGTDVKCSGCGNVFHAACGDGVATRSSKTWRCKDCRLSSTSNKSASVSTSLTKEFLVRVLEEFKNEMFAEFKNFRSEMNELSTSVQFLSDKVDASSTLMNDIKQELASIKKDNVSLRSQNVTLIKQVDELQERVRNLEQYSRINNIEISGIPATPNEEVRDIVKDVGAALGVEVLPTQISAAHRIPAYNRNRIPAVVVQFTDRTVKEALLAKFREARSRSSHLTADKVNRVFPPNRVYVNDHLTPENKQFLAKLKQKCQEVGIVFVWCRDGKFFVRRAAGDKVQKVSTLNDIESLK